MKKQYIKLFLLVCLLIFLQFILADGTDSYRHFAELSDKKQLDFILEGNPKILMLGDSSLWWGTGESIPNLVQALTKNQKVSSFALGGQHVFHFRKEIEYITKIRKKNPQFIIELNMRSFDIYWHLVPNTRDELFSSNLLFGENPIFRAFYKFIYSFKIRDTKLISDDYYSVISKQTELLYPYSLPNRNFLMRYGVPINSSNFIFTQLSALIEFINKNHLKAFFYITPIDYEQLTIKLSPNALSDFQKNLATVSELLTKNKQIFVDLSHLLPHSSFDYQNDNPNEHLNAQGKELLAKALVSKLELQKE